MGSMFCGLRRMAFASREEGGESSGSWQAATPEAAASAVVDALRHLVALCQYVIVRHDAGQPWLLMKCPQLLFLN